METFFLGRSAQTSFADPSAEKTESKPHNQQRFVDEK
jgi:hypothetical protein